ncbi:ATP-binding protein [Streptomyces sp. NPDC058045]|uniref:ATP-binding protein n=1 Tax=Streptomyces sp. NPDC058045 TaxID=3346311 RepID=UPI0036EC2AE9
MDTSVSHGFHAAFEPTPVKVAEMRRATAALLQKACLPESLASDVVLAVSELVTNAIVHGDGEVGLHVSVNRERVRVSVSDQSPDEAFLMWAEADCESGRGMNLVAELAAAWGVEVTPTGKKVWAELRPPAERRAA